MKNIPIKKAMTTKFIGLYLSVLLFIVFCSLIAVRNVAGLDESQGNPCFTKQQEAKTTGHLNEMLFSMKSFILFE